MLSRERRRRGCEAELATILGTIRSAPLKALADEILADGQLMAAFSARPAGVKHHHAYAGGLLDHVVNLLRLADRVAPLYPALDRDLLLVGVLVHDIGKTVELESQQGFLLHRRRASCSATCSSASRSSTQKIRAIEARTGAAFDPETAHPRQAHDRQPPRPVRVRRRRSCR